jgi:fructosamine-3-kinase
VHGHDEQWLVTEHIPAGRTDGAAAERLGRQLATLHAAGAAAFGTAPPGGSQQAWIGAAPMTNVTAPRWPQWYAEHRVLRYLRSAVDNGAVDAAGARAVRRTCERIEELAGPDEPPARLHGDLWSGNVHAGAEGRAWLLDPAAHGGHRETDLAMLALFGWPNLARLLAGYTDVAPLAPGWQQRMALHQLFPLLVHAVLFGGGYGVRAAATARAAYQ